MTEAIIVFYVYSLAIVYLITDAAVTTFPRLVLWHLLGRIVTAAYCRACVGFWVGVTLATVRHDMLPGATGFGEVIFGGFSVMLLGVLWTAVFGSPYAYEAESRVFYETTDKNPDGNPPADMPGGFDVD